jgi:thiol-disulfide isomerase/thioredoxin
MKKTTLLVTLILLSNCLIGQSNNAYLEKVLRNLQKIKSAAYSTRIEPWAPGDTAATNIFYRYYKEYNNSADSTIGASFVALSQDDTTKMMFCYDGTMKATVYDNQKYVVIDSFQYNSLPFRPITPPFFNYAKSILKYALETEDRITIDVKDLGDSVYFNLTIHMNKQVEFFGKPYYIDNPYSEDEVSRYEIWINDSNDLPYRIRREMSHDISVTTCKNVDLNKNDLKYFLASDYFPADCAIKMKGLSSLASKNDLMGKVAPDWILNNADNKTIALQQLKSKVLMIQFTSVSCGPCRASISFLKQLASEYNEKDFHFVSIESWNRNSMALKRYQARNDFNYDFLLSTVDLTKSYQIQAVPVFYILDKNRVIRKVITGYGTGTTDKKIRDAINELL